MNGVGPSLGFALRAVVDLTGTIFVPAIAAAFLGKFLDTRAGTGHILFAVCLALAFIATAIVLVKKIRQYAKEYQQLISR